jgi:hypothetical protein
MDAAVKAERQLQDMLEIVGHHRVAPAVRQPVGMQRHERAAGDGEEAEAHPRRQQRYEIGPGRRAAAALRAGQRIDDAPEQHRLGELRRRQRHIGNRQHPAEPGLVAQKLEHTCVQANEIHDAGFSADLWPFESWSAGL